MSLLRTIRTPLAARAAILALTLAAIALVAGCGASGGSSGGSSSGGPTTPASGGAALDGTSWRLDVWTLSSLDPADFTMTAEFADGRIGGKSAVNSYGGSYTTGSDGSFSVGQLVSTQMAGPEPEMRAEQAHIELLSKAASYKVDGDTLTLYDSGGNESLGFAAAK